MTRLFQTTLKYSIVIFARGSLLAVAVSFAAPLAIASLFAPATLASEIASSQRLVAQTHSLDRINPVSKLVDIKPTDWTFQALQSLIERYGCIAGFEDNTYRGNRSLSRYEFAAALDSCLENITKSEINSVNRRDLTLLHRLQADFARELALMRGKIDGIEARTTELEANQFSPTTKLEGEVLLQLGDSFSQSNDESQTFLGYRARLYFDTSFTGKDLLRTRLEAKDIGRLDEVTDTVMTRLGTDGESADENEGGIDLELFYRFPLARRTEVLVGPKGVDPDDIAEALSPFSSSSGGAVSRFGRRDPATLRGPGGTGLGFIHQFSDRLRGSIGYFASSDNAADPEPGNGLFNGSYSALAQLVVAPTEELDLALTYTHKYEGFDDVNVMDNTGSFNANEPFGKNATASDNLGWQFNWKINSNFELGGWVGYTKAHQEQRGNADATIWNGALTFAFPDLLAENNLGGIIIGVPPIVTENDEENLEDPQTSLHLEALYRIEVTDQIEITPGVFVITNPNHEDREAIWVGTIRTKFSF
ncbi:carbohydrate porin [Pleurocapsales cyanobacterium LEGE 06147]|nr:carbohydrate porin [Pleurocapsales cyanobacterium LEGE 06147]